MRKIIGVTVGTPISPRKMEKELKPVKAINGQKPDKNGNVNIASNIEDGSDIGALQQMDCMADAEGSTALGTLTEAGARGAFIAGRKGKAYGKYSFVGNYGCDTSADNSTVFGNKNSISESAARSFIAGGTENKLLDGARDAFIAGTHNITSKANSAHFGCYNYGGTYLLTVGNGNEEVRRNAFAIKAQEGSSEATMLLGDASITSGRLAELAEDVYSGATVEIDAVYSGEFINN